MSRFQVFCKVCLVAYRVVVLGLLALVAYGVYDVSLGVKRVLAVSWGIDSRLDEVPSAYSIECAVSNAVPGVSHIEDAVRVAVRDEVRDAVRDAVPDAVSGSYGVESKLEEILDTVEAIYRAL